MIYNICKECTTCNREKDLQHNFGITINNVSATKLNEIVGLDIKGPISTEIFDDNGIDKNLYILVMVDLFLKFIYIKILTKINSKSICESFEKTRIKK